MEPDKQDIEDQAAQLPRRERARLALRLIESLEPGPDENVEELWLDEAERRLKKYDEAKTQTDDAEEAISDIERNLR